MRVCNLGSGSDGNITYIETQNAKVLLDIGVSALEATKRLALLKVLPEQINAIIISHEHSDHIKGVDTFATKYKIPVYVPTKGKSALCKKLKKSDLIDIIEFDDFDFKINDLTISNFPLPHDSEYCSGFSFLENKKKVSILTDLGHTNSEVLSRISGSVLVYLEANHDLDLLRLNRKYPEALKRRILGKKGHLSNLSAAEVIKKLAEGGTKQIMLSHLSKENNTPQLAYDTICNYLKQHGIIEGKKIKIATTSIYPSCIFKID